jgi:hypothetical protein
VSSKGILYNGFEIGKTGFGIDNWVLAYVLSVHSLSPPKPAGLDPQKFRSHTPNWLRNVDSKKKFTENVQIFFFFFLKTWLAEICKVASLHNSQCGPVVVQLQKCPRS